MTQTTDAALVGRLAEAASEIAGWGAGNEAQLVRQAADTIEAQARRIEALEGALRGLEQANDTVAAGRTQAVYLAMIDSGQSDALAELDFARRDARALLTKAPTP